MVVKNFEKIAQNSNLFFKGLFYIGFYVFFSVIGLSSPLIRSKKKEIYFFFVSDQWLMCDK